MQDKEKKCIDCPNLFVFTAKDQQFYQEKGFQPPKRCLACRDRKKKEKYPNEYRPQVEEQYPNESFAEPQRPDRRKRDRRQQSEW